MSRKLFFILTIFLFSQAPVKASLEQEARNIFLVLALSVVSSVSKGISFREKKRNSLDSLKNNNLEKKDLISLIPGIESSKY